ncbi:class I SAM-dependent methyltransferase [Pseudomonas mangiferae]|uniref:Class I SAM-dependent methyltransferase n=1 Tax=Pseudomonas mangiferae TaxID=2593654 RepID=A0A553H344_9PSED|nr:class I SAM-dependent methyltransferase [Pseudomonas mangiferae]TRX76168.1 class I SAM-dependent methyltransferase [Pseudomonas mangiferae]
MENDVYLTMDRIERDHWWFRGRRVIVESLLKRTHLPGRRILDVGCGTGGNLALLSGFGDVLGIEPNPLARERAKTKAHCQVKDGYLPDGLDVEDGSMALISMFDVLEHIKEDKLTLESLHRKLSGEGVLFLTIPAYGFLFSEHDRRHHHVRRYTRAQVKELLRSSGFTLEYISYFNTLLFPLAVFQRIFLEKIFKKKLAADELPSRPVNMFFFNIMAFERHVLPWLRFPFGLSIVAVARKK